MATDQTIHTSFESDLDADPHDGGPAALPGQALTIAEATFQLLITGPSPLAIDGQAIGHGLPARPVDLGELKERLLNRTASDALKDAAWAELVHRSRTHGPAWVIGCVGVAMPGLKNIAARVIRTSPERFADDIVSELLTEFIAQLARIDTGRRNIAPRLLLWARKGALRVRGHESRHVPLDPHSIAVVPSTPGAEPGELLADAVRQQIITPAAADLITATRLDGVALTAYAHARAIPADRLYKQRKTAEAHLVAAITEGQVSAMYDDPLSNSGLSPGAS
jgi:hypothetical protein